MTAYKWERFQGSQDALRYARRDLPNLDQFITLCPSKRVAVQAGANLGIYPKRLAAAFGVVYCFEPSPDLFPIMVANAPERNIIRFQAALGERVGLIGTSCARRDQSGRPVHEGLTHIAGAGVIPMIRLDDLQLPICDFLQLDLEGYEMYALTGAMQTIERCKPVIVVEINKHAAHYGFEQEDVRRTVVSFGYKPVLQLKSDEAFMPCQSSHG